MARYNQFAGRPPKGQKPFKISFTGTSEFHVLIKAKTWLDTNPNRNNRKIGKPKQLENGQWSVSIS